MCTRIYLMTSYSFWFCPPHMDLSQCNTTGLHLGHGHNRTYSNKTSSNITNISIAPSSYRPSPTPMVFPSPSSSSHEPSPTSINIPSPSSSFYEPSSSFYEPSPSFYEPSPSSSIMAPSPMNMPSPSFYEPSPTPIDIPSPANTPSPTPYLRPPTIIRAPSLTTRVPSPSTNSSAEQSDDTTENNSNLQALHVLWTIPISGLLLWCKCRSKSAQIKAGWQGRKMKRSQSWHVRSRRLSPINSRWKSEPPRKTDFDSINEITT